MDIFSRFEIVGHVNREPLEELLALINEHVQGEAAQESDPDNVGIRLEKGEISGPVLRSVASVVKMLCHEVSREIRARVRTVADVRYCCYVLTGDNRSSLEPPGPDSWHIDSPNSHVVLALGDIADTEVVEGVVHDCASYEDGSIKEATHTAINQGNAVIQTISNGTIVLLDPRSIHRRAPIRHPGVRHLFRADVAS